MHWQVRSAAKSDFGLGTVRGRRQEDLRQLLLARLRTRPPRRRNLPATRAEIARVRFKLARSPWHKTKRPGLSLSHKALSRSALPQVLLNPRIQPSPLPGNGTIVPDGITFRPLPRQPSPS